MRPESIAELNALGPGPAQPPARDLRALIETLDPAARPAAIIRADIEEARSHLLARASSRAQPLFFQSWTAAMELGDTNLAVDAAFGLALTLPRRSQAECFDRALVLVEKSTDPSVQLWLAPLCLARGWHSFDLRKFDEALVFFERALAAPYDARENVDRAAIRWSIGRALRALDRADEALKIQLEVQDQMSSRGDISGHVFLEIGECMHMLRKTEGAKTFFEQAHTSLSTDVWYRDNRASELQRMKAFYKKT